MAINPQTMAFVKKVTGTSLKSSMWAYYKHKKGYTVQPKRGKTSQKDPVARRLNLYAGKVQDGRWVTHIYAQKSRVMRGTDNLLAVKLNTGEKGWITDKGLFIAEDDVRKMLYSVDQTLAGISEGSALLDLYDSLSVADKAKVAEAIRDYDWESFWKEMYPTRGSRSVDNQYENYDELVERIAQALGR